MHQRKTTYESQWSDIPGVIARSSELSRHKGEKHQQRGMMIDHVTTTLGLFERSAEHMTIVSVKGTVTDWLRNRKLGR